MRNRDALDRRAEAGECLVRNDGGDSRGNAAVIVALIGDHHPAGLLYRGEQSIFIQRLQGSRIDNLRGDSFLCQGLGGGQRAWHLDTGGDDGNVTAFVFDGRLTEGNFIVAVGNRAALVHKSLVGKENRRVLAFEESRAQQSVGVGGTGRHRYLQARRVPLPRLRAPGMLDAAATANPVAHEIGNRHVGLPAGVRVGDGRLVDDLRNSFVRKRRRADVDEGSEPCHGGSRCYAAKAKLCDGRRLDPAGIFFPQTRESRLAGSRADQASTDQYHAGILLHDFAQGTYKSLTKGHFLRHSSVTSSCVSKVERSFWIRERAFQCEARRRIGLLANLIVQPLNLFAADAAVFDQLPRIDQYRVPVRIPGAHGIRYSAGIPSPCDVANSGNELGVGALVARPRMGAGFDKERPFPRARPTHEFRRGLISCAHVAAVDDSSLDVEGSGNV